MAAFAEENGLIKNGWLCLVASYFGENILMTTDYLKWCPMHGLHIQKCYLVLEFRRSQPFTNFVDFVSENRRRGDCSKEMAVIAETSKLVGNSAYGIQLINKSKFESTQFADKKNVTKKINSPLFKNYDEIDCNIFEFESLKKKIINDEPLIVGFVVLKNAKQRMLEFKYNFLGSVMRPRSFRAIEMDTDSWYMAITGQTLEECFTEEARERYHVWKAESCSMGLDYKPDKILGFLPRQCCSQHSKYDSRTPGLLKVDFVDGEMVCLNSKTYCTVNTKENPTIWLLRVPTSV